MNMSLYEALLKKRSRVGQSRTVHSDAYKVEVLQYLASTSESLKEVADKYGIKHSTLYKWRQDALAALAQGKDIIPTPEQQANINQTHEIISNVQEIIEHASDVETMELSVIKRQQEDLIRQNVELFDMCKVLKAEIQRIQHTKRGGMINQPIRKAVPIEALIDTLQSRDIISEDEAAEIREGTLSQ